MENYLSLFEQAIRKQSELVGEKIALEQAKMAGLGVSKEGHIVSCSGNPQLVLMRLIKFFTADGNLQALTQCTPLINKLLKIYKDDKERTDKIPRQSKVTEPY